ncbi:bifunctional glycosyltransferase/CDP-glycerol:glycerophosphate glycerophosphotransferase [Nocardioides pocheonensis]|uniref:bifunctional glycosyltransferase/CDP-glycerol:glycerophosphate glycerophosphotransferase n=1 Tax=Nocardioides pocheonensis TaxID=661485 RepID=UPI00161CEA86|nr:CDP-glycerol glycerophosphotransferase family protein [Nocardioides pocheonensis]
MTPRFSIVTAVYDVDRFLEAFIASVDAQTFPADRFEVVAVDDGSTDTSATLLAAWAERRPGLVRVLTKENGGQSSARNLGLEHARGEWVTFADPDDVIEPGYLAEVDRFLTEHPETGMVACNLLVLQDATGELEDTHPLKHRFRGKARVRDLDDHPGFFFVSAPVAFFRRDLVEAAGLRFDPEIRPNFEDGHFSARYLLGLERPLVGFVPGARYHYRKRADVSSTLAQSKVDPERYTRVLRLGYLDLVKRASEGGVRPVPQWLQNVILYELSWILSVQHQAAGLASRPDVVDEFEALMTELLDYLDPAVIDGTPVARLKRLYREILLHSWRAEPWCQEFALLTRLDEDQDLVQVVYRFTKRQPREEILSDGVEVVPPHAKVRDYQVFGRTVIHERILWLPAGGPLRIRLDGRDVALELDQPRRTSYVANPPAIRRKLGHVGPREKRTVDDEAPQRPTLVERLACSPRVRRRYAEAWLLMDRLHDADDNAQRLFEYLRAERPEIDAWFTVKKGTPAWRALRKRFGRRVVAHGSLRWAVLALNARHLLSSHADLPVIAPRELEELTVRPRWRYTFLQHGVIKDDLSTWLNVKPIDLFVTSTNDEYHSVADDHTGYVFTTREAILTGLPRFDRLRALGEQVPEAERNLVLVAPTWRSWLTGDMDIVSQRREVAPHVLESEFMRLWLHVLTSERLRAAAEQHGAVVGFLPHPNLQPVLEQVDLPDWVRPLTFDDDVQQLFARARVLVTDYSSMAFNTAYLDRPVVYFQFDRDRVLGGEHVGSRGYFDYERDGYGPVVLEPEAAVDALVTALDEGLAPEYLRRVEDAFPLRDGRCCERVTEAVLASTRKVSAEAAGR